MFPRNLFEKLPSELHDFVRKLEKRCAILKIEENIPESAPIMYIGDFVDIDNKKTLRGYWWYPGISAEEIKNNIEHFKKQYNKEPQVLFFENMPNNPPLLKSINVLINDWERLANGDITKWELYINYLNHAFNTIEPFSYRKFLKSYQGEFPTIGEYAFHALSDSPQVSALDSYISSYIDWEGVGDEMCQRGKIWTVEKQDRNGIPTIHVFKWIKPTFTLVEDDEDDGNK